MGQNKTIDFWKTDRGAQLVLPEVGFLPLKGNSGL